MDSNLPSFAAVLELAQAYRDHARALYRWTEEPTSLTARDLVSCFSLTISYERDEKPVYIAAVRDFNASGEDCDVLVQAISETPEGAWRDMVVAFQKRLREAATQKW